MSTQQIRSLSHWRRIMGGSYIDRVLDTGPIGYWPMDELDGHYAYCRVSSAQTGDYVGVTLGDDNTGPFGTPAPLFDGINDYVNIATAPLIAAFSGSIGSMAVWCKVSAAGVWTDGTYDCAMTVLVDGGNYLDLFKWITNNTYSWRWRGGGSAFQRTKAALSTTEWFHVCLTWDDVANTAIAYCNGAQEGAVLTLATDWAGTLASAFIGAASAAPATPWYGWLAHAVLWDRVVTPAEAAALAAA